MAHFPMKLKRKSSSLGKYSTIKPGNSQLMSEQFSLVSSLKSCACCDTSGNTTSVLSGKHKSNIGFICSMKEHAVAQPVLDCAG